MGLMAIVGNASLITKSIYLGTFSQYHGYCHIYNLLISMVPMLIVVMITSTKYKSNTVLPFILPAQSLSYKDSFILSSAMVYL